MDHEEPSVGGRPPEAPPETRLYAVGDVHGRLDLLLRMETLIEADIEGAAPGTRIIQVMLGDYIDRGPDSSGVVSHLIRRARERDLVLLRGNHEAYVIDCERDPAVLERWCRFGGRQTLASYGIDLADRDDEAIGRDAAMIAPVVFARLPPDHLAFYAATRLAYRAGDYLFVHAGIRPGVPLDEQTPLDLTMIRQPFHGSEEDFGLVVIHGHTPTPEPVIRRNRIGIDTKAYESGRLTCLVLEGRSRRFLVT